LSGHALVHSHFILDAIETFDQIDKESTLQQRLSNVIAAFGYEYFCYAAPPVEGRSTFGDAVLLNGWPKAWFDRYRSSNFHVHDPVTQFSRKQTRSFKWSQAPIDPDNKIGRSIMEIAASDHLMRFGVCIPIHGLRGYQASISFAGFEIDDRTETRSAMEIIAVYAVNRCHQFRSAATPQKILTPREREIMAWVAAGKSAWDIGGILRISEDTVNKIVASAMRRLNACNRPQAVAESIRRGEITP
jgi:LuxR family transcriptional regulator, quorum-sensing system regulator BjaR1